MSHETNDPSVLDPSDFDILRGLVAASGWSPDGLTAPPDVTIFAPTDEAFIRLAQDFGAKIDPDDEAGALAYILQEVDERDMMGDGSGMLMDIMFYHVSRGGEYTDTFDDPIKTITGPTIDPAGSVYAGNPAAEVASLVFTRLIDQDPDNEDAEFVEGQMNIEVGSTVIHVIDQVMLPMDVAGNENPTILDGGSEISETDDVSIPSDLPEIGIPNAVDVLEFV